MRNIIRYGTFLFCVLFLLTSNASALSNPSNDNTELENNSNKPMGINICIDFIPYTHEELRNNSDTIVTGTVKEILPPRWNTADGKRPFKLIYQLNYPDDIIYTDIVISVDEYLKNPLPSEELIVRVTGGTVEGFSMTTDADPIFKTGEKVLLYLNRDKSSSTKDIGPEHFIVTDFYLGKYTLTDDGKAVRPDETVTLEELLSTVKDSNSTAEESQLSEAGNKEEFAGNDNSLYSEVSGSIAELNLTELIKNSDTIVTGTVKEILPGKWNTLDGKRPDNIDDAFSPSCLIYTDTVISVDEYLKNPLSSREVTVRVVGGTVGNDTLLVDYEPTFQSGEKVLLFLMKNDDPATKDIGPQHFKVTGFTQGKYTLTDDGKAVRPDETVSQEELLSTINQIDKKSASFISSFWTLVALLGAVLIIRRR